MNRETIFSPDRLYRYTLWRQFERPEPSLFEVTDDAEDAPDGAIVDGYERIGDQWTRITRPGYVNFLMLNPSTADETQDDPTIRRCIGFAKYWGFSELCVTNIFAYRATDPKAMRSQVDPIGPENDRWIEEIATGAAMIVTAWGKHGSHRSRDMAVLGKLLKHCGDRTYYLKKTNAGEPCHPLYLPADIEPRKWIPLYEHRHRRTHAPKQGENQRLDYSASHPQGSRKVRP